MYQIPPSELPKGKTKYRYDEREPKTSEHNTLEIVALVLGIIAILTVWNLFLGIVLGAAAVMAGILGKKKASQEETKGRLAVTGIALGIISIIITLLLYYVLFAAFDQGVAGASVATKKSDANSVMYAVELYRSNHSSNAPKSLDELKEAGQLSHVPGTLDYYRDPADKNEYRICTDLGDKYYKCEAGTCLSADKCGEY
ncbi:DUF4190 domain-containing protein [Patescibacteria group bacterium]